MKQRIIENINSPGDLEKLYRENSPDFSRAFNEISDDYDSDLVRFWKIRLAPGKDAEFKGFLKMDLFVLIGLSLFAALLIKIPLPTTKSLPASNFLKQPTKRKLSEVPPFRKQPNKLPSSR